MEGNSKARQYAYRVLKIRPRSIFELREKLKSKGFGPEVIEATLTDLIQKKLLDDRAFTASWIQYRLARPFGFRRICLELRDKGIAEDLIAAGMDAAKKEFSEEQTVAELAHRRAGKLGALEPLKRKKRIFDYLIRRGFPVDVVIRAVKIL